jgi:hypothetical protein
LPLVLKARKTIDTAELTRSPSNKLRQLTAPTAGAAP